MLHFKHHYGNIENFICLAWCMNQSLQIFTNTVFTSILKMKTGKKNTKPHSPLLTRNAFPDLFLFEAYFFLKQRGNSFWFHGCCQPLNITTPLKMSCFMTVGLTHCFWRLCVCVCVSMHACVLYCGRRPCMDHLSLISPLRNIPVVVPAILSKKINDTRRMLCPLGVI